MLLYTAQEVYCVCVWAICEPLEKKVSRCVTLLALHNPGLSLYVIGI